MCRLLFEYFLISRDFRYRPSDRFPNFSKPVIEHKHADVDNTDHLFVCATLFHFNNM